MELHVRHANILLVSVHFWNVGTSMGTLRRRIHSESSSRCHTESKFVHIHSLYEHGRRIGIVEPADVGDKHVFLSVDIRKMFVQSLLDR